MELYEISRNLEGAQIRKKRILAISNDANPSVGRRRYEAPQTALRGSRSDTAASSFDFVEISKIIELGIGVGRTPVATIGTTISHKRRCRGAPQTALLSATAAANSDFPSKSRKYSR